MQLAQRCTRSEDEELDWGLDDYITTPLNDLSRRVVGGTKSSSTLIYTNRLTCYLRAVLLQGSNSELPPRAEIRFLHVDCATPEICAALS